MNAKNGMKRRTRITLALAALTTAAFGAAFGLVAQQGVPGQTTTTAAASQSISQGAAALPHRAAAAPSRRATAAAPRGRRRRPWSIRALGRRDAMTQLQMAAMGTDCLLILHGPEDEVGEAALARAAEQVRQYEERFSRFRPDSELSRLNESPQEQVPVDAELGGLLARSVEYARISGGLFDPVVLDDLLALGYDRTFEEVRAQTDGKAVARGRRFRWRDISVDAARSLGGASFRGAHRPGWHSERSGGRRGDG